MAEDFEGYQVHLHAGFLDRTQGTTRFEVLPGSTSSAVPVVTLSFRRTLSPSCWI